MRTVLLILLSTITSLAQETQVQQFEILGVGRIQARADHTVLKISVGDEGDDRNKLIKETNDKTEIIRKVLLKAGLTDDQIIISDIMTIDNSVYRNFDNESTSKFEVYRVINARYIFDKDLNSKISNILATHELQPVFRSQFGLSDDKKNSLRNELIKRALEDAKSKADIIASTYNVKIKRILKVKYGNTIDPALRENSVDVVGDVLPPYYTGYKEDSPEFDYMETVLVTWQFEE